MNKNQKFVFIVKPCCYNFFYTVSVNNRRFKKNVETNPSNIELDTDKENV